RRIRRGLPCGARRAARRFRDVADAVGRPGPHVGAAARAVPLGSRAAARYGSPDLTSRTGRLPRRRRLRGRGLAPLGRDIAEFIKTPLDLNQIETARRRARKSLDAAFQLAVDAGEDTSLRVWRTHEGSRIS